MSKPRYDWWPYVKGMIRRYPQEQEQTTTHIREREAVAAALERTGNMRDGDDRLKMVRMIFWQRSHTLDGVALELHYSWRTVAEWHRDFIREVAKQYGFFD